MTASIALRAVISWSLLCAAAGGLGAAEKLPLPKGVPTLDQMAGDWKPRTDLVQYPSLYSFNSGLHVNKDFASVSWLTSPPFSQGFHSGVFKVDGQVPVAD